MTLSDYLARMGISQTEFAARLGVSRVTVCGLCNGRRAPSFRLACRIAQETYGAVPVTVWQESVAA